MHVTLKAGVIKNSFSLPTISLLQSALFDLKKTLLQNGYPRGVLCYNINHVLNRQKNKSVEPIATVPKKDIFLVLPFLGSQSEVLA